MVAQSLSSLLQRASIDDHEEAIQSCDEVLAKSKNDSTAQYIKIIALLKLDRYEDALRVLEAGGDAIKKQASFEYAYVLYKLGKLEEALQAVSQMTSSRGASHLEAQVVCSSIQYFEAGVKCLLFSYRATALSNSAVPPISTKSYPKETHRMSRTILASTLGQPMRNFNGAGKLSPYATNDLREKT